MTRREILEVLCFSFFAALLAYSGGCARNLAFDPDKTAARAAKNSEKQSVEENSGAGELHAMSFNLRYGTADDGQNSWRYRKDLVFDTIRQSGAEVVGVQEALDFQLDEIRAALPGYGQIGVGRDDGRRRGEYSAILYDKNRFEVTNSSTFWLSDTPEVVGSNTWAAACTRICTWAHLVDKESGSDVWVFNTHFDHISGRARERSAKLIAQKIKELAGDGNYILTGDFNADESTREIKYLEARATVDGLGPAVKMVDTFRRVHPDASSAGTFGGFRGAVNGAKIDYIFVSAGTKVLDAQIIRYNEAGRYPSDHYPVTATVLLN